MRELGAVIRGNVLLAFQIGMCVMYEWIYVYCQTFSHIYCHAYHYHTSRHIVTWGLSLDAIPPPAVRPL